MSASARGPFLCYKELVPPTCIDIAAFFTIKSKNNQPDSEGGRGRTIHLITCTSSTISVYGVEKTPDLSSDGSNSSHCLVLLLSTKVYGRPQDVAVHKLDPSCGDRDDHVVLSFDTGKVVVAVYNPVTNTLDILRVFNAEDHAIGLGSNVRALYHSQSRSIGLGGVPILAVDSANNLACTVLYSQQLFIMPLLSPMATNGKLDVQPSHTPSLKYLENNGLRSGGTQDTFHHLTCSGQFVVDLPTSLKIPGPILDVCFVEGYKRPVVAVLLEAGLLPVGHAANVRHTCALVFLAINVSSKTTSIMWRRDLMPHDSLRIYPIPANHRCFTGGVFCVSMNGVIVVSPHNKRAVGIATNGFASMSMHPGTVTLQPSNLKTGYELDCSKWVCPDNLNFVGALKDGTLLQVRVITDNSSAVYTGQMVLELVPIGTSVPPSSLASIPTAGSTEHLWFVGSRHADGVLMGVKKSSVNRTLPTTYVPVVKDVVKLRTPSRTQNLEPLDGDSSLAIKEEDLNDDDPMVGDLATTPVAKRQRKQSEDYSSAIAEAKSPFDYESQIDAENAELYGPSNDDKSMDVFYRYFPKVMDTVAVLGPVTASSFGRPDDELDRVDAVCWDTSSTTTSTVSSHKDSKSNHHHNQTVSDADAKDVAMVSAGLNSSASLVRVSLGLRVTKLSSRMFTGAVNISAVASASRKYQLVFLSFARRTKVFRMTLHANFNANTNAGINGLQQQAMTIREIAVDGSGFLANSATVAVGRLADDFVVQVVPNAVRLMRIPSDVPIEQETANRRTTATAAGEPLQDLLVSESEDNGGLGGLSNESVVSADIRDGWVVLVTSREVVYLLQLDAPQEMLVLRYVGKVDYIAFPVKSEHSEERSVDFKLPGPPMHASLFYSHFPIASPSQSHTHLLPNRSQPTTAQLEELELYGDFLGDDHNGSSSNNANSNSNSNSNSNGKSDSDDFTYMEVDSNSSSKGAAYVVISTVVDGTSTVLVYNLETAKCHFQTSCIERLPEAINANGDPLDRIPGTVDKDGKGDLELPITSRNRSASIGTPSVVKAMTAATPISISGMSPRPPVGPPPGSERRLVSCRVERLTPGGDVPYALGALCLVGLMDTGDLCVYKAICSTESSDSTTTSSLRLESFVKVSSTHISYRKRSRQSRTQQLQHRFGTLDHLDASLSAEVEEIRGLQLLSHIGTNGRTVVMVSGSNRPAVVANDRGLPYVIAVGFPEVPYENYGVYAVAPWDLLQADSDRNTSSGYFTLWAESGTQSRGQTQLAVYKDVLGTTAVQGGGGGSSVGIKKIHAGLTVHKTIEMLKKSEDRNEMLLLDRKLTLMVCSQDVAVPFHSVPTLDEKTSGLGSTGTSGADQSSADPEEDKDEGDFFYYFTNMHSFASPEPSVGGAPALCDRQYRLAIMQQGSRVVEEYHLFDNERVLDVDVVYLPVEVVSVMNIGAQMHQQVTTKKIVRRLFVVVGTATLDKHGEDCPSDGRLLLFGLDHKRPATDEAVAPTTTLGPPKLNLLSTMVGPASIVRQLGDSYVLATVGAHMFVHRLDPSTMALEQISFFFAKFYISAVSVVKNYIIIADAMNNVMLLHWRPEDWLLTLISKDYSMTVSRAISFISGGSSSLGMVTGDDEGNIQLLQYDPKREAESAKGARLICLADFHLGSELTTLSIHAALTSTAALMAPGPTSMLPPSGPPPPLPPLPPAGMNLKPNLPPGPPPPPPPPGKPTSSTKTTRFRTQAVSAFGSRTMKTGSVKTCLLSGTMDGEVGMFLPVDEKMFKRLNLLQHMMSMSVESACAMNPKNYRLFKSARFRLEKKKGVLDGSLLWKFVSLEADVQDFLASSMGTSVGTILETLQELDTLSMFF